MSPFPHAACPAACARVTEILVLPGLLARSAAAETGMPGLPDGRVSRTVAGLLEHQPGCARLVSGGFAVSLIAPVLLSAGLGRCGDRRFLCRFRREK